MAARKGGTGGRRSRKAPTTIDQGNGEAPPDKATVGTGNRLANVKARADQIRQADRELSALEKKKAAKQAEVQALGKDMSNIYRKIKSDLGISRKHLEFQRQLAALQNDERLHAIDELREAYLALHPGEQSDFLTVLDPDVPEANVPPVEDFTEMSESERVH